MAAGPRERNESGPCSLLGQRRGRVAALAPSCGSRDPFADGDRGGLRAVVGADVLGLPRSTTGSSRRNWAGLRWAGQFDRLPARGERHRAQDDLVIESAPRLGRYALHAQAVRKKPRGCWFGGYAATGGRCQAGLVGTEGCPRLTRGRPSAFSGRGGSRCLTDPPDACSSKLHVAADHLLPGSGISGTGMGERP